MTFNRAKFLRATHSYGHYLGSCLRSISKSETYLYCENENFCGTNIQLNPHISPAISQLFRIGRRQCDFFAIGDQFTCSIIEEKLKILDENDCFGVLCDAGLCVDHVGYFTCSEGGEEKTIQDRNLGKLNISHKTEWPGNARLQEMFRLD